MKKMLKKDNGITLVALIVTIIVLIILAGISINLILGDNGIITIAQKAKENTELAKVEEEKELNELYMQLENNEENTGDVESGDLKAELAQTNATADKILKDYKAYSKGKLLTGTMENYAGQTVTASTITENGDNVEITIPSEGYYGTDSRVSIPISVINDNLITKFEGSCRVVTLTNTYTSYNYIPTKYYKKITIDIKSFSNLQNVCIKDVDGKVIYSKSSTGSFSYDITDYDAIIIASTAISGVAGTALMNFKIE